MGFLRRLTGAQQQIDAADKNAKLQEDATRQAAANQAAAMNAAANAAAQQQALAAERAAAQDKAEAIVSAPLAAPDVSVANEAQGATSARRQRRARFGQSFSGGVRV